MDPKDVEAARLAILVARATVSRNLQIRGPLLRLRGSKQRFSADDVVARLAEAPKPLLCQAREAGGNIEVHFSPLDPGTRDFAWHNQRLESERVRGGFMSYLSERGASPVNPVTVYCVGRDEALLLTLPAVQNWHRDYFVGAMTMRGDRVENPLCTGWPQYVEAKRNGAVGILIFSSPADDHSRIWIIERKAQ